MAGATCIVKFSNTPIGGVWDASEKGFTLNINSSGGKTVEWHNIAGFSTSYSGGYAMKMGANYAWLVIYNGSSYLTTAPGMYGDYSD